MKTIEELRDVLDEALQTKRTLVGLINYRDELLTLLLIAVLQAGGKIAFPEWCQSLRTLQVRMDAVAVLSVGGKGFSFFNHNTGCETTLDDVLKALGKTS